MAPPATDCAKKQKKKLSDYLNSLEEAAKNAARALYHRLGQLLCALANGLLAVLEPLFALEKIMVENFVIFPLGVIASTFSAVTNGIAKPVNALADSACTQHGTAIKAVQGWANKGVAMSNKFQSFADSATKWLKELDDEIQGWQIACGVLGADLQTA